jgi:hypothetical protein
MELTEIIPDEDVVYHIISGRNFQGLNFAPSMIRQQGTNGISVDWCRYSTPEDTLAKFNIDDCVVSFAVRCVRQKDINIQGMAPHLSVVHDPVEGNHAHALIVKLPKGNQSKMEIRNILFGCLSILIKSALIVYD